MPLFVSEREIDAVHSVLDPSDCHAFIRSHSFHLMEYIIASNRDKRNARRKRHKKAAMWLSGPYFHKPRAYDIKKRMHAFRVWKQIYMAHKIPMDCTQNALKIAQRFMSAVCHQSDMCASKNECAFYSPFQFNFATTPIEERTNALVASMNRRIQAIRALVRLTTLYTCTVVRRQCCTNRILLPLTETCPRATHTILVFI